MSLSHLPTWTEEASSGSSAVNDTSESQHGRRQHSTDRTRATPLAPQTTNRPKPTIGQYINDPRAGNYEYHDNYATSEGKRGTFLERDAIFDEFKYRELCLNAASRTKMVTSYLAKIKDHILKEASLEWEVVSSFGSLLDHDENSSARYGRRYMSSAPVPKEAQMLENSSTELQNAATMCIKAVAECLQSRKTIYLTQLKKIRDTSNMATRNAVQHERSEAGAYMNRLKESLEAQRRQEVRACEDRIVELENTVSSLRSSLESASADVARLSELEQNRVHLQSAAVAAATEQCRRDHAADRERQQASWSAERARLIEDTRGQLEEMKRQNEIQLEMQRQHERELRELVVQDKARAEAETAKVREELVQITAKLTSERERFAARLQEEKERAERDQQAALAEAVKGQAQLRAELATTVQRQQMEELKRHALQDQELAKYREQLLTQHSLEIEKINERHRNEMKKYQAELQVRSQDAVAKLKHVHEQEVNRLIRDNERLHRIIVRHGGAEAFRGIDAVLPGTALNDALNATVDESVNASYFNAAQSPGLQFSARKVPLSKTAKYATSVRHSLTPSPTKFTGGGGAGTGGGLRSPDRGAVAGVASASRAGTDTRGAGGGKRGVNFGEDRPLSEKYAAETGTRAGGGGGMRVPDSPPPPPPRQQGAKADDARWGALAESLRRQEEDATKPKYSSTHLPPEPFVLDASLATARSATNRQLGVGARSAAESSMEYAKELDRYLKRGGTERGKADGPTPASILQELPGTLGSVLDSSSHSSGNFNALATHTYHKERERMGLGLGLVGGRVPRSPGYDSDSCDPSSDDELAGEDLVLSATKAPSDYR